MGNTLFIQLNNIAGDQAIPSTTNTIAFNPVIQGGTDNGTDTGVHTGGIATAGKYTNTFNAH
jgi:hypothetical protein